MAEVADTMSVVQRPEDKRGDVASYDASSELSGAPKSSCSSSTCLLALFCRPRLPPPIGSHTPNLPPLCVSIRAPLDRHLLLIGEVLLALQMYSNGA